MTDRQNVDLGRLRIKIRPLTDMNFHKKAVRAAAELFAPGKVPDLVDGYHVGAMGVLAYAVDERGIIVGAVSGKTIEHANKPRFLCVSYAGSNPPYLEQGLELQILAELMERIEEFGVARLVPTAEVAAQVRCWLDKARGEAGGTPPK